MDFLWQNFKEIFKFWEPSLRKKGLPVIFLDVPEATMRILFLFLLSFTFIFAKEPPQGPSLLVHNAILAKVRSKTITVLDVVKQLDLALHNHYPELVENPIAKAQFYQSHWKKVLQDMIDTELILLDAKRKDIKITGGEVHEELEARFGPNTTETLEKLKLTKEEAFDMIRKELLVQKMSGYFVYYKAQQLATPEEMRKEYQKLLRKNPPTEHFCYKVITIKSDEEKQAEELAQLAYKKLKDAPDLTTAPLTLQEVKEAYKEANVQISSLFEGTKEQISKPFLEVLEPLKEKELSQPVKQLRKGVPVYRLFYLERREEKKPPSFESMSPSLKQEIFHHKAEKASRDYLAKLRKEYAQEVRKELPKDFQPFSLSQ